MSVVSARFTAAAATAFLVLAGGVLIAAAPAASIADKAPPAVTVNAYIDLPNEPDNEGRVLNVGDTVCPTATVHNLQDSPVTVQSVAHDYAPGNELESDFGFSFPVTIAAGGVHVFKAPCNVATSSFVNNTAEAVMKVTAHTSAGNFVDTDYVPTPSATMTVEAEQQVRTHYDVNEDGEVSVGDVLEGEWTVTNTGNAAFTVDRGTASPYDDRLDRLGQQYYLQEGGMSSSETLWYPAGHSRSLTSAFPIEEADLDTNENLKLDFSITAQHVIHPVHNTSVPVHTDSADQEVIENAADNGDWIIDPADSSTGSVNVAYTYPSDRASIGGDPALFPGDEVSIVVEGHNLSGQQITGAKARLSAHEFAGSDPVIDFDTVDMRAGYIEPLATGTYTITRGDIERGYVLFGFIVDSDQDEVGYGSRILYIGAGPQLFEDVSSTHPFGDEILWLADSEITTGYDDGTFRPTGQVTRQAFAAYLYRYSDVSDSTCTGDRFSDVNSAHPFCAEIEWLADTGITDGYDDGSFGATRPVTRQAMAAFLHRYHANDDSDVSCDGPAFPDVSQSNPFCGEIDWLASTNITSGYDDGNFKPSAAITRQAMAAFLYRYDDTFGIK